MKKRNHQNKRKSWTVTRRLLYLARPSKAKTTPRQEPMLLATPPEKCDKCGNTMIVAYEECESKFTMRMARCPAGYGGCGKTWRLA